MDEYNMSHTGAELDDAINKFKSGYIKPSGTLDINENGIKNVKEYESVNVDVKGADVSEVTATEEDVLRGVNFVNSQGKLLEGNIIRQSMVDGVDNYIPFPNQNYLELSKGYYPNDFRINALLQEKTVSPKLLMNTFVEPDSGYALSRVIVNGYTIPDSYINKDSTEMFVTQSAEGTYTTGSDDVYLGDISINIGFKPKIFFFVALSGLENNKTSQYALNTSLLISDNNYNVLLRRTTGIYFGSDYGSRTAQSSSSSNTFFITNNGVQGGASSSFYAQGGAKTFNWYAWG